jgi:phenylalanyl-tRNA synthetase beta chain
MCVIADENGVESIAGIMGGEHSGCDENTTDVLIESALWNPMNIARTGRDLGIITDARYRFERGVDPEFMVTAWSWRPSWCSRSAAARRHNRK